MKAQKAFINSLSIFKKKQKILIIRANKVNKKKIIRNLNSLGFKVS